MSEKDKETKEFNFSSDNVEDTEALDEAPESGAFEDTEFEASENELPALPEKAPATIDELRVLIEGILFASDRPLSVSDLSLIFGERVAKEEIESVIAGLKEKFSTQSQSGILFAQAGDGYQFRTATTAAPYIYRLYKKKPKRLSPAALEVLAVVAYRQPVTRGEVEEIRGVDSGGIIRQLLDRKLVRILGHREEPGRPLIYATTPKFLEFIGVSALNQLPTLQEFYELSEEHRARIEKELGDVDETKKRSIISDLLAMKKRDEEEKVESEQVISSLDSAVKEMEDTFKSVANAVGLLATEEPKEGAEKPATSASELTPTVAGTNATPSENPGVGDSMENEKG